MPIADWFGRERAKGSVGGETRREGRIRCAAFEVFWEVFWGVWCALCEVIGGVPVDRSYCADAEEAVVGYDGGGGGAGHLISIVEIFVARLLSAVG